MSSSKAIYTIRLATAGDAEAITSVEILAAYRFSIYDLLPEDGDESCFPVDRLQELIAIQQVWVASIEEKVVGFAVASQKDATTGYLEEVDVSPDFGNRGIGRALVEQVLDWAKTSGCDAVVLSTFASIPWNAPFYAKLGFEILPQQSWNEWICDVRAHEQEAQLPMHERVIMRKSLR